MSGKKLLRRVLWLVLFAMGLLPTAAPGQVSMPDRVVVGTVVSIHPSSVTVRVPNLLGYLRIRIRTYRVRRPASLAGLRPGDRISGVLSRADGMLHRVRRIETVGDLERRL